MDSGHIAEGGSEARAGMRILALLGRPLSGPVLEKLAQGPQRFDELRRETGSPPRGELRACLRDLERVGAVTRRRSFPFPSPREYELKGLPGQELRFVATTLEGWLAKAPEEPLSLGSEAARRATQAFVEGWATMTLHALGRGASTVPEVERAVGSLSSSGLDHSLEALRATDLVEARWAEPPRRGEGEGGEAIAYAVTDWTRQGMAPLMTAIRWERRHRAEETAPTVPADVEAGFMLMVPLIVLPAELSGSCRLTVELAEGEEHHLVGVTVGIERGSVESCVPRLEADVEAWAIGRPATWLRATIEADPGRLERGGNERLVHGLLDALNQALFGPPTGPERRL